MARGVVGEALAEGRLLLPRATDREPHLGIHRNIIKGRGHGALCAIQHLGAILLVPILYGVWHTNGRSEGGSYTAQSSCNSIAPGWAMQVGAGNERRVDSCTQASKSKNIL